MTMPPAPPVWQPPPSAVQSCRLNYETRTIVVAYGVGHRPIDGTQRLLVNELNGMGLTPAPTVKPDGFWYDARFNHPAFYIVRYVYTKAAFSKYLQTPNIHLIYTGHSRGGQGPCFLDKDTPEGKGEYWGDTGTFRMGFDFCAMPTADIKDKEYTPHLVVPGTAIDVSKCEPAYLASNYSKLAARTTGAPPKAPMGQYMAFDAPDPELGLRARTSSGLQPSPAQQT